MDVKTRISVGLWLALVLVRAFASTPDDLPTRFANANKLYEQAQYAEAAAAFAGLLQKNGASPALYFNLGNALFKSGQVGQAIANYRLAERLTPRDPDVRANLRFARDSVSGGASNPWGRWRGWLNALSANELAVLLTVGLWVWFALLTLQRLRSGWQVSLRGYTATAGVVTGIIGLWLALLLNERFQFESGVVVAKEAVVRYGPVEESQSFYTLHDGAEVIVLNKLNAWLQVQDSAKRVGWLQTNQVALLPPG